MNYKIRWGIVGPGNIARKFTKDLIQIDDAQITAVASRSIGRSKSFADEFHIDRYYDNYDQLFNDPNVDIVYIATPHNHHAELSKAALLAGKAVLSEKPSAMNKAEIEEVIELSKKKRLFYMEGLWSRFNPLIQEVYEKVQSGTFGELKYLKADFGFFALNRPDDSRVLNPSLGGGSLLDIGIYPVFLAYLMLGKPNKIKTIPKFYKTGAEVQISIIFDYDNAQAVLYSGFVSETDCTAQISGTKGRIHIDTRWHEPTTYHQHTSEGSQTIEHDFKGNGFSYEIEEVHRCLKNNLYESNLWSHQNTLDLIGLLDDIRADAAIEF
ncbi:MAG: Gfo/Idh/MocA family oxidoreductase [Flavobacteriaceae bacterium]|jgi:predicted dehydrogenase|nr:Gfo/Idh/MocA family oxidoreductase [Flavobacteriaceae bacterium]